jgi:UDP-N-acetylglucosamine--N-acetylmuramyl-(pentapeptide) pyrophosphoryl-undecaprenol N-acetylglucosamine transferase
MRILMSGGGTGGHVYPLLAVVQALVAAESPKMNPTTDLLYVGCAGGPEQELAGRAHIPFRAIAAGGVRSKMPWTAAWNALKLLAGLVQALGIIGRFRPDAILVTGGYVSVPVALAGRLRRAPLMIYLPDVVPGLAIQRLARWATRVAVSFDETLAYFEKGKAVVTGYPVRASLLDADKSRARQALHLRDDLPVATIFGGSRGAHHINTAVAATLAELLPACQVVHICGHEDAPAATTCCAGLPVELRERYHPYAYLHDEMAAALAAADVVVARAGASTLGELPVLGLPGILVPYPYSGQHQDANADYLVRRGAALQIADADLDQELAPTLLGLLRDQNRLQEMARCARELSRPDAARRIVAELAAVAAGAR